MKKVICFARVSSQHQDLQPQIDAVKRQILNDSYKESEVVVVMGKESAIKLKEEERQTLNELKEMVAAYPTIESVYFFAVDRLARRMSVVMSVKEWADEHKLNLVFLNPNPMQTFRKNENGELVSDEYTNLLLAMMSFGAQMEMKIKQERFNEAKTLRRKQNKVTGSLTFGYTSDDNGYIIKDDEKAAVVVWVFDCYLNKAMSCAQIYKEGVELGYWKEQKQKVGGASKIRHMLTNKLYCGKPSDKSKYNLTYPSIIDEDKIDQAIELLAKNKKTAKKEQSNIYYCKSILRDEESNTVMVADRNHVKYNATCAAHKYGVNMNVADSLIWLSALTRKWMSLTNKDDKTKQDVEDSLLEISYKKDNLNKMIESVNAEMDKNYKMYLKGRIKEELFELMDDDYKRRLNELKKRINDYEKRELELNNVLTELEHKEAVDVSLYSFREIEDDKQRKEIINDVVTNMTVRRIRTNWYLYKVYNKFTEEADKYLYVSHGGTKTELYQLFVKDNDIEDIEGTTEEGVESGMLVDISSELKLRFKREKR